MSSSMVNPIKVATSASVATPSKVQAPIAAADGATSPKTDTSGDTLHDDESSDVRSSGDGLPTPNSPISPISPESLNFGGLDITGGGVDLRKNSVDRYNNPFERMQKQHNEPSTYGPPGRDFRNHQLGAPYGGRGDGGFRQSRTWMSPDAQVQQEFLMVRNAMRRLFKNSDIAKWKLSDYVAHKEAMLASQTNKLATKVKNKEDARAILSPIPGDIQKVLNRCGIEGNFEDVGNYGRALGEQTIWCNDWDNGKDEIAPWPSMAEMKWEGDDRAKTGVGRFLPLPREEGPPGLMWNQLPVIEQYPIDQVCKIPTMEDVYLPVDYQIEEDHEYLWSKELEMDIDAFLDS